MLVVHIDLRLLYALCSVCRLVIPVYLELHLAFKVESNFAASLIMVEGNQLLNAIIVASLAILLASCGETHMHKMPG